MKEKKEVRQEAGTGRIRIKMTLAGMLLAALAVGELYLMLNDPKNYTVLGALGLAILCFVYLLMDLSFQLGNETEDLRRKEYENIYKAEKVSYVLMKQNFLEMEKILERIRENSEIPADELIQAQKAIGKIVIQKSKENALAAAGSNDRLAERIDAFRDEVRALSGLLEQVKDGAAPEKMQAAMQEEITAFKEELTVFAERMETQLRTLFHDIHKKLDDSILTAAIEQAGIIADASPDAAVPEAEPDAAEAEAGFDMPEFLGITPPDMTEIAEETAAQEPIVEEPAAEEIPEIAEEPAAPELPDAAEMPETVEEPIAEAPAAEEMPEIPQEPIAEEIPDIPEQPDIAELPDIAEMPEAVEEPIAQEPIPEEMAAPELPKIAEMPKIAEPPKPPAAAGRNMTPEEIAALLAETSEPEKPEVKPAAPLPVSNDPGHVMTPEEIAALLASM